MLTQTPRVAVKYGTQRAVTELLALKGDHARAKELYQRSLERAGPTRTFRSLARRGSSKRE